VLTIPITAERTKEWALELTKIIRACSKARWHLHYYDASLGDGINYRGQGELLMSLRDFESLREKLFEAKREKRLYPLWYTTEYGSVSVCIFCRYEHRLVTVLDDATVRKYIGIPEVEDDEDFDEELDFNMSFEDPQSLTELAKNLQRRADVLRFITSH